VDVHLQDLRRRAGASGNVQDQAALLRARVRAGELAQELLELAAFCGSEAARLVVDPGHQVGTYFHLPPTPDRPHGIHGDGVRFDEFVNDLARWADACPTPGWMFVRAAVAAAKVGIEHTWAEGVDFRSRARAAGVDLRERYAEKETILDAIKAAEAWLDDPHGNTLDRNARLPASSHGLNIRGPAYYVAEMLWQLRCGSMNGRQLLGYEAENDVRIAGEATVRTAIRDALVAYALGAPHA
jgi:hypothetical protein